MLHPRIRLLTSAVVLLAVAFAARAADPPTPPDTVDAFRAAFRKDLDTILFRSLDLPLLRAKVKEMETNPEARNADDLARARDNVTKAEKELAAAFTARNAIVTQTLKADLADADPADRAALANLIADEVQRVRYPTTRVVPDFPAKLHPEVPTLIALTEPGPKNPLEVRVAATRALGRTNGDPKAIVPALAKLLRDPDSPIALRLAAAEALGRPINHLLQSSQSVTPTPSGKGGSERDDAFKELHVVLVDGGALTWPVLLDGFKDKVPEVRLACARAARELSSAFVDQAQRAASRDFSKEFGPLLKAFRDEMPKLLPALDNAADPPVRQLALTIVEDLAVARLHAATNQALELPPKPVSRAPAPATPGFLPDDPPLQPVLVQGAPAKDLDDLSAALAASVPGLVKALQNPSAEVRLTAAHALESIGNEAAGVIPDLARALSDRDRFVRWTLLRTLGRLAPREPKTVVAAVALRVGDEDIDVRLAALKTIEHYAKDAASARPAIARTIARDDAIVQLAGLKALQSIGDGEGATLGVVADLLLNAGDVNVRVSAAETLGRAGKGAAAFRPALQRAVADDEEKVRSAASEALLRLPK